jgi:hypothetical protein
MRTVDLEGYKSEQCWFNDLGEFSSLMVMAITEGSGVPYFVSVECIAKEKTMSEGGALLYSIKTIEVDDSTGALDKAFPNIKVRGNVGTDLPLPSSTSSVYLIKARLSRLPQHPNVFSISSVITLQNTNLNFEHLLAMPIQERAALRKNLE